MKKRVVKGFLGVFLIAVLLLFLPKVFPKGEAAETEEVFYGVNCFDVLSYEGKEDPAFMETGVISKASAVKYLRNTPASYGVDHLKKGDFVIIERPLTKENRSLSHFLFVGEGTIPYVYREVFQTDSAGEETFCARFGFYMPETNVTLLAIYSAKWDKKLFSYRERTSSFVLETESSTTVSEHVFPVDALNEKISSVFALDLLNNQLKLEDLNGKYKIAGGNTALYTTFRNEEDFGIKVYLEDALIGSFHPGEQVLYATPAKEGMVLESAELYTFDEHGDKKRVKTDVKVANILRRNDEDSFDDAGTAYEKQDVFYFVMPVQEREVHLGNPVYKEEMTTGRDAVAEVKDGDETVKEGNLFVSPKDQEKLAAAVSALSEEVLEDVRTKRLLFEGGAWYSVEETYALSKRALTR